MPARIYRWAPVSERSESVLDRSAIFLRDTKGIAPVFAGVGYAAFSIAMATMRLAGDKLAARVLLNDFPLYS